MEHLEHLEARVQYHLPISTISLSPERSILETDPERRKPPQRGLLFISKLNVGDFKETAYILVLLLSLRDHSINCPLR